MEPGMNTEEMLAALGSFKERLERDVLLAYESRGIPYGNERFEAWKTQVSKFLDMNLPGSMRRLDEKLRGKVVAAEFGVTPLGAFMKAKGNQCTAFIDSLMLDLKNCEYDLDVAPDASARSVAPQTRPENKRVFIVHGHDDSAKVSTARFVEKLGFEAIILHEQASKGMTIIEKIESYTEVGFAIVLYTPDDTAGAASAIASGGLRGRARQNVVFEHGFLIAKLGRANVVALVSGDVELPSDISGIVYIASATWQIDVAKEMKSAGYLVDFNKII